MAEHKDNYPFVSIVVPVLNGQKVIEPCINSLEGQSYPRDQYEIIVIDNGSKDRTEKIIESLQSERLVFLREHQKKGSYAARNLGIKNAKGSIIAFTDADCVADKNWLIQIVHCFQNQDIIGVAGKIKALSPETIIERYQKQRGELTQEHLSSGPFGGFPLTANAAYRKKAFDSAGLFDDGLFSGGDLEFAKRIESKKAGEIFYQPQAIIYHKHRTSLNGLWKQRFRYGFGIGELSCRDLSFDMRLRIYNPWLYIACGFLYCLLLEIKNIFVIISQKKEFFHLYIPLLDFLGEIAFRRGYQKSQSFLRNYHLFNFPKQLFLKDYLREKNICLRKWGKSLSVVSLYLCGSLAKSLSHVNPGISDIDFIPVLKNEKIRDIMDLRDVRKRSNQYKTFFFNQENMFISEENFLDLRHFIFLPEMKYKHEVGHFLDIQDVDLKEKAGCSFDTVFGILLRNLLKSYDFINQKDIDVSEALNLIYSQRHTVSGLKSMGFFVQEHEDFTEKVSELRKRWFFLKPAQRKGCLINLLRRNSYIQKRTIMHLSDFMRQQNLGISENIKSNHFIFRLPRNIFIVFSDELFEKNNSFILEVNNFEAPGFFPRNIKKIFRLVGWKVIVLPKILANSFLVHGSFDNEFSRVIKNCLYFPRDMDFMSKKTAYSDFLKNQSERYNKYWRFLSMNNLNVSFCAFINLFLLKKKEKSLGFKRIKEIIRKRLEELNYQETKDKIRETYETFC